MPRSLKYALPTLIGLTVSLVLWSTLHWWGLLIIFSWCGFAISTGMVLRGVLTGRRRLLGRKVALLMILPCLLFFVPIVNRENFQLEGVALIVMVGFFSKGFIHYLVAKLLGPLIWRRGFCGYACWTAAVLDWLPIRVRESRIPRIYRRLRYLAFALSLVVPAYLVFGLSYDVRTDYLNRQEMTWMFVSNGIYYAVAVPLAFLLRDRRAFCKYVCPVPVVMTPAASVGLLKIKPNPAVVCTECGACNRSCPMGVDVMGYMQRNQPITDTECVLCNDCTIICPERKIF
jgi:ferredoxin-type protein NapH